MQMKHKMHAVGLMVATKDGLLPAKPTPEAKISWLFIQSKDGSWHWADGKNRQLGSHRFIAGGQ